MNVVATAAIMIVMPGPWLEAPHYVALLWPASLMALVLVFTSMSPGTTGFGGGRPSPSPVIRLFSFLVPKREVDVSIDVDGRRIPIALPVDGGFDAATLPPERVHPVAPLPPAGTRMVPLIALAHGRSGDKGDKANVGIVARRPEWLALLSAWLTPERVAAHFAHNGPSRVERFDLAGFGAMNFLLHDTLGGGGMASLRTDNLAKCYAQVMLSMPVPAPADFADAEPAA